MTVAVRQVADALREAGLFVDAEHIDAFDAYLCLVRRYGEKFNLVSARDLGRLASRHLLESFNVLRHPITLSGRRLMDIGSGAGFPAIPLAIWQRDLEGVLVESVRKKAEFLARAVDGLGLASRVAVVCARAEDVSSDPSMNGSFDLVTARGTGRLTRVVGWSAPFLRRSGYLVAFKGLRIDAEMLEATSAMDAAGMKLQDVVPLRWGQGNLVILMRENEQG